MCPWALRWGSTGSTSRHSVYKNEDYNVNPSHWEVGKCRRNVHVQVCTHFLVYGVQEEFAESVKDSAESRAILPYYTLLFVLTSHSPPWPVWHICRIKWIFKAWCLGHIHCVAWVLSDFDAMRMHFRILQLWSIKILFYNEMYR